MNKEYWVVKITDDDGCGYVFKDPTDGYIHWSSIRYDTAKFYSKEDCQQEIEYIKNNSDLWQFSISKFTHIRPVKVKVKQS